MFRPNIYHRSRRAPIEHRNCAPSESFDTFKRQWFKNSFRTSRANINASRSNWISISMVQLNLLNHKYPDNKKCALRALLPRYVLWFGFSPQVNPSSIARIFEDIASRGRKLSADG